MRILRTIGRIALVLLIIFIIIYKGIGCRHITVWNYSNATKWVVSARILERNGIEDPTLSEIGINNLYSSFHIYDGSRIAVFKLESWRVPNLNLVHIDTVSKMSNAEINFNRGIEWHSKTDRPVFIKGSYDFTSINRISVRGKRSVTVKRSSDQISIEGELEQFSIGDEEDRHQVIFKNYQDSMRTLIVFASFKDSLIMVNIVKKSQLPLRAEDYLNEKMISQLPP